MATYTEDELQAMSYPEIIKISKEFDVFKARSKKVYLINKILSAIAKVDSSNDENRDPAPSEEVPKVASGTPREKRSSVLQQVNPGEASSNESFSSCVSNLEPKSSGRSTFNSASSLAEESQDVSSALPTGTVASRRSTFNIQDEKTKASLTLPEESPRNSKRSALNLNNSAKKVGFGTAFSIKPLESEGSCRRGTFVLRTRQEHSDVSLKEGESSRRSTFFVKTPTKDFSSLLPTGTVTGRRSTFNIKDGTKEDTLSVAPKNSPRNSRRSTFNLKNSPKEEEPVAAKPQPLVPKTLVKRETKKVPKIKSPVKALRTAAKIKSDYKKVPTPSRAHIKPAVATPARPGVTPRNVPRTMEKKTKASVFDTPASKTPYTPGEKKHSRVKMPNFTSIHAKQFSKMESVVENKERLAKRALDLMSPLKPLPSKRSGIPVAVTKLNATLPAPKPAPLLRKEEANKRAMKNPPASMDKTKEKSRNLIQGVRANKRFLLQMQMRNINA